MSSCVCLMPRRGSQAAGRGQQPGRRGRPWALARLRPASVPVSHPVSQWPVKLHGRRVTLTGTGRTVDLRARRPRDPRPRRQALAQCQCPSRRPPGTSFVFHRRGWLTALLLALRTTPLTSPTFLFSQPKRRPFPLSLVPARPDPHKRPSSQGANQAKQPSPSRPAFLPLPPRPHPAPTQLNARPLSSPSSSQPRSNPRTKRVRRLSHCTRTRTPPQHTAS